MFAVYVVSNWFLFIRSKILIKPLIINQKIPHFLRENERLSISFETQLLLVMVQEMAKINMEELSIKLIQHEITWMPISDTKSICSHALSSRTHDIVMMHLLYFPICSFHCWHQKFFIRILFKISIKVSLVIIDSFNDAKLFFIPDSKAFFVAFLILL